MKNISIEQIAQSAKFINSLSLEEKEVIFDRIYLSQPHIFAYALGLSQVDVPLELIDHVLHLLLVFYHSFTENEKIQYPVVSEDDIIAADNNTIAMFQFLDNEEPEERQKYENMSILNYPERNALAYMSMYLRDNLTKNGTTESRAYCVRAAKNIFDSFCRLKKEHYERNA